MGVFVTGYTEARINGKWYCIDFFQYDGNGNIKHCPCISGQSMILSALQFDCSMEEIFGPDDLSDKVRELCTGKDGVLLGTGEYIWYHWYKIEGSWFEKADLDQPEYCGFFPTNELAYYLSNPTDNWLNGESMISAKEYHDLSEEERKAYKYYEYTNPSGTRKIMQDFKKTVLQRVNEYSSSIAWYINHQDVSLADVRVLILKS